MKIFKKNTERKAERAKANAKYNKKMKDVKRAEFMRFVAKEGELLAKGM